MNRLRKKPETRVTIVVGIIIPERIILACDSQTTAGSAKRVDTTKITPLTVDEHTILVAESGDCTLSARAVELLDRQMFGKPFDDYRMPADAAQEAVRLTKQELIKLNNWENQPDMAKDYFDNNPFALMIGYFSENVPLLYVLNSVPGFATRVFNFACMGCGGTVAEFILSRADLNRMGHIEAFFTAIYAVEEVKKVDTYCGGQTKAAMLSPRQLIFSESQASVYIKCAVETMQENDAEFREKWAEVIHQIIKKTHARNKELSKPPPTPPDPDIPF